MKQNDLLLYGALGIGGLLLYNHFKGSAVSTVPPLIITGWANGVAQWQLGTAKGTLNTNGTSTVTVAGPFSISVNDFDGAGYDITVLSGSSVVNSLYVNSNGTFT